MALTSLLSDRLIAVPGSMPGTAPAAGSGTTDISPMLSAMLQPQQQTFNKPQGNNAQITGTGLPWLQ